MSDCTEIGRWEEEKKWRRKECRMKRRVENGIEDKKHSHIYIRIRPVESFIWARHIHKKKHKQ